MAQAIRTFMIENQEGYWIYKGQKVPVTTEYLRERVDEAWEAAPLCPSWCYPCRKDGAKRLLGASYTEARLWSKAISRKVGLTGHHAYGGYQVYAGNWLDDNGVVWRSYNKAMGYDPPAGPETLWNPKESAKYAAWWTQIAIDHDMDPYHFNRTTSARKLYTIMSKVNNEDSFQESY